MYKMLINFDKALNKMLLTVRHAFCESLYLYNKCDNHQGRGMLQESFFMITSLRFIHFFLENGTFLKICFYFHKFVVQNENNVKYYTQFILVVLDLCLGREKRLIIYIN